MNPNENSKKAEFIRHIKALAAQQLTAPGIDAALRLAVGVDESTIPDDVPAAAARVVDLVFPRTVVPHHWWN